ncbi:MAG: hypothetical protein JW908_10890 [Anaerolineales bacterium]|nr:hypothetical protein [Anaerolineales bacterium]
MKHISLFSIIQSLQHLDLYSFDTRTFASLFSLEKIPTAHLLARLESNGLIARIERGKYLLLGLSPERVLSNPLFIGNQFITPSYISFWSALHFFGFTEQVPRMVFIATTFKKTTVVFRETRYKFVTLPPERFFGYRREIIADLPVVIADEARAIIDSMLFPQHAGGMLEIAQALRVALNSQKTHEYLETLVDYSNRIGNLSLGSRLGFLLELLGHPVNQLQISNGPVALDPQLPRIGEFNPRWKIYVNIPPTSLFPEGVV